MSNKTKILEYWTKPNHKKFEDINWITKDRKSRDRKYSGKKE